jgi:hypothetical protein
MEAPRNLVLCIPSPLLSSVSHLSTLSRESRRGGPIERRRRMKAIGSEIDQSSGEGNTGTCYDRVPKKITGSQYDGTEGAPGRGTTAHVW